MMGGGPKTKNSCVSRGLGNALARGSNKRCVSRGLGNPLARGSYKPEEREVRWCDKCGIIKGRANALVCLYQGNHTLFNTKHKGKRILSWPNYHRGDYRFRVNFDGSFIPGEGLSGAGFVVRHRNGSFIAAGEVYLGPLFDCTQAEAHAFFHALDYCFKNGYDNVQFEGDLGSLCAIFIKPDLNTPDTISEIIDECKKIWKKIKSKVMVQVPREVNCVPDELARCAIKNQAKTVYLDCPPFLERLVFDDKEGVHNIR